jgi:hypothetical protein
MFPLPLSPLSVTLFVVAVLATLGWCAVVALAGRATRSPRITQCPPTTQLGPESPAVVDLITGDWRLCEREAASATLLDLAARRVVTIEEIGPALSLVRLRRGVDTSELRPYETLVLDHVTRLAVDGVVATGALAEGARNLRRWWKKFHREVIAEARRLGLSEPRLRGKQRAMLTAATALPGAAVAFWVASLPIDRTDPGGSLLVGTWVGFVVCAMLSTRLSVSNAERGTAEGAAAAGRWLGVADHMATTGAFTERPAAAVTIWGRSMAYAAALGLTPMAVSSLPVSTEASATRAWSDYGGLWHPVEVRYGADGFLGRFWGRRWLGGIRSAPFAAYFGFVLTIFAELAVALLLGWGWGGISLPVWAGAAAGAVPLSLALLDCVNRTRVEGQVVRSRTFERANSRSGSKAPREYWIALDDGQHRSVSAYATDADTWNTVREGDIVRAIVGPHLGWIYQVQVLTPSRHRTHPDALSAEETPERPPDPGEILRSFVAMIPPDARTSVAPSTLLTPDDCGRVLGVSFGPPEPIAFEFDETAADGHIRRRSTTPGVTRASGLVGCRYRCDTSRLTVDVYAVSGKTCWLLWLLAVHLAGKPPRRTSKSVEVAADVAVVRLASRAGCLIRVNSPHAPPGDERMSHLGRAAAARIHTLAGR